MAHRVRRTGPLLRDSALPRRRRSPTSKAPGTTRTGPANGSAWRSTTRSSRSTAGCEPKSRQKGLGIATSGFHNGLHSGWSLRDAVYHARRTVEDIRAGREVSSARGPCSPRPLRCLTEADSRTAIGLRAGSPGPPSRAPWTTSSRSDSAARRRRRCAASSRSSRWRTSRTPRCLLGAEYAWNGSIAGLPPPRLRADPGRQSRCAT